MTIATLDLRDSRRRLEVLAADLGVTVEELERAILSLVNGDEEAE